ncbi:MAG: hypothetical protein C5B50_30650 [Verrucomicrobia bacterium]|nr:MAG: hypothetical protein C5B50_30650 [Verrucomicrobiota bacterium]
MKRELNIPGILAFMGVELPQLILIIRIWSRRRKVPVWSRLFWSTLLLVPFLGLLFYLFLSTPWPDEHADMLPPADDPGPGLG